jgi:hypothetical protein
MGANIPPPPTLLGLEFERGGNCEGNAVVGALCAAHAETIRAGEVSKMSPAVQSSFAKMTKGDVADEKFWK